MLDKHIFLVGFMGTGKSSVSNQLGQLLAVDVLDTDQIIVEQTGQPISRIFEERGEEGFRKQETAVLHSLAERAPAVISCGGGIVLRQENVDIMKREGRIVCLLATPETVYERVKHSKSRPLLNGHMEVSYIAELMKQREGRYQLAADEIVKTDGLSIGQVAQRIASFFGT